MFKFLSDNVKKMAVFALALAMTAGVAFAVPGQAQAATGEPENDVVVDKTATLESDGTYTINLEAYATGKTTLISKQEPVDVVLVLDMSQSMDNSIPTGYSYQAWSGKASDAKDKYHKHSDNTYHATTLSSSNWKYKLTCNDCNSTIFQNKSGNDRISNADLYEYKSSGSIAKKDALKSAAKSFITDVAAKSGKDGIHRIAVVSYNETAATPCLLQSVTPSTAGAICDIVDKLGTKYYTRTDLAMTNAAVEIQKSFNDQENPNRKKVVVVFTDGVPTNNSSQDFNKDNANKAISSAYQLKKAGVTVYTIGVLEGADPTDVSTANTTSSKANRFLNLLSSNYPDASGMDNAGSGSNKGYYKVADNASDLQSIFTQIQEEATSTSVNLDDNSLLKDIIADGFDASSAKVVAKMVPNAGVGSDGVRKWETDTSKHTVLNNNCIHKDNGNISVDGYDYNKEYVREENGVPKGSKLVVTITGVVPTDDVKLNEQVDTNNPKSGIYKDPTDEEPMKTFPQPKTIITEALYVVDYAKPFSMAAADWKQDVNTALYKNFKKDSAAPAYGKLDDLKYTPSTTNWNGFDTFYAFGQTSNSTIKQASANANGNLWSKVSVLPANNVYYEDEFITNTDGVVGIEYEGNWEVVGTQGNNEEQANTAIHGGWQNKDLADDAGDSNGSSHHMWKDADATFEFYGTGVDVYTRTDTSTLTIVGTLYEVNEDGTERSIELKFIDNYAEDSTEASPYYQIPTLNFEGLTYGHYKVNIRVNGASGNYYLDGIRVYNPLKGQENNSTVQNAYKDELAASFVEVRDKLIELGSFNRELSKLVNGFVLIDKILPSDTEQFGELEEVENAEDPGEAGDIAADAADPEEMGEDETEKSEAEEEKAKTGVAIFDIALYKDFGPKNEVYLGPGQGIAFAVDPSCKYSIGLKAPKGATKAAVTQEGDISKIDIKHSTDLYYPIDTTSDGLVVVRNDGTSLLAVTKLKSVAGANAAAEPALASVALGDLLDYANMFDTLSIVSYQAEAEEEEPETPEVTEPEPQPEVTPDVEIVVPEPAAPAQPTTGNRFAQMLKSILNALKRSR